MRVFAEHVNQSSERDLSRTNPEREHFVEQFACVCKVVVVQGASADEDVVGAGVGAGGGEVAEAREEAREGREVAAE